MLQYAGQHGETESYKTEVSRYEGEKRGRDDYKNKIKSQLAQIRDFALRVAFKFIA